MVRTEGLAKRLSANSSSLWPMWSSPSFISVSFLLLFSPSFPHIRFHTFSFFSVCLSWISVDMIQMLLFITQKFDIWAFLYSPPSEKSFFGDSKSNPQDLTLPEFMAERRKCVPDTNRYYFGFASTIVFRTFWRSESATCFLRPAPHSPDALIRYLGQVALLDSFCCKQIRNLDIKS